MFSGIIYALSACLIWGLIFIVPQFMSEFSSIEVALGRYIAYGTLSTCIFSKYWLKGGLHFPRPIWLKALFFSLMATFMYYTAVVFALRYANPAACTLVLGISPVAIAFYGNWKQKECSYKTLILPSILILFGLLIINAPHFAITTSPIHYLFGVACSFISLIAWSWYVVANSEFLRDHPTVSPTDWSTLIGISTVFWVLVCGLLLIGFFPEQLRAMNNYSLSDAPFLRFLGGCAILGVLCSWLGAYLWNQASLRLPVSLAGQLTIFETVFGLMYVYLLAQQIPPVLECLGIAMLLGAVGYSIRTSNQTYSEHAPSST